MRTALSTLLTLMALAAAAAVPLCAQVVISADGQIESQLGGFRFPDGRTQGRAAAAGPAPVEDSGQRRCYQPAGAGAEIACGGTGQDGEKQAGVDWPAPRFTDNRDGTVTDNLTGLIWLRDANCGILLAPSDFDTALAVVALIQDGFCDLQDGSIQGDWQLPNIRELLSLMDYGQSELPALPSGHPFVNVQSAYWSSSTIVSFGGETAWEMVMSGQPFFLGKDQESDYFWPVRRGQPVALEGAVSEIQGGGVVESTSGGFRFPDGSVQTTAAPRGAPVAITGQTRCYDSGTGATIACSGTGQDGDTRAGVEWPTPRFTDNLDGTVTDHLTGLVWLKDASCDDLGNPLFENALTGTSNLEDGFCGLTDGSSPGDWRVPTIKELLSLVDYQQSFPCLPPGHPFVDLFNGARYWSSTTNARDRSEAWLIEFGEPFVFGEDKDSVFHRVWPVRGGR